MNTFDAVVIGGGPAGLTAALYLTRSGCSVALVEKLTAGGQVLQTEAIDNYPGFPKGVKGYELADLFAAHLADMPVKQMSGQVHAVKRAGKGFKVVLDEQVLQARVVLVCSGAAHKHLGVEGEARLSGRGVSYCAICDGNFFRGQDVAVVGGGNTALEETLYLSKIVNKVYLIHRREGFRGAKIYQDKIFSMPDKVELIRNTTIAAIHGDTVLEGLTLRNVNSAEERHLPVAGLFVFVGLAPSVEFLPKNVNLDTQGFVVTDTEMRTSVPGIFAAGDIRSKLCRQVTTAVGDGATAAHSAFVYLENLNA